MIPPAKDLTTAVAQIKKGRACAERIEALLNETEEDYLNKPVGLGGSTNNNAPAVELSHVSFSYTPETLVLDDVSTTNVNSKTTFKRSLINVGPRLTPWHVKKKPTLCLFNCN